MAPRASTLVCRLDFLSGRLVGVVEILVKVTSEGDLTNVAVVGADESDFDPSNNTARATVTRPTGAVPPTERVTRREAKVAAGVTRRGNAKPNTLRGTRFADRLLGLGGNDRLFGLLGNDRLLGGAGHDLLNGAAGADFLDGGKGNDVLLGGTGNNRLFGRAGNDRLKAGKGVDLLVGGAGNDVLLARDGRRDTLRCGSGRDTVTADKLDRIARDCERVKRR